MADNNENISFNIVDTMEMAGNTELINDLMSPETTSTSPDEVQPIVKEVEEEEPVATAPSKKPKEIDPDKDKSDDGESLISSFLEDDEDKDDDELPVPPKAKSPEESSQEESDSPDGNQFSALANDLFKLGVFTKDEEDKVVDIIKNMTKAEFKLLKMSEKIRKANPPAPFTTSTLQQSASYKLNMDAKRTMSVAQKLYEAGYITYMRTDSFNVSDQIQKQAQEFIKKNFGDKYCPEKPPQYLKKVKGAQEAHESIHPTDVNLVPDSIKDSLTSDEYKLYDLIWKKFISSQMENAVFEQLNVEISDEDKKSLFKVSGRTLKFDGYLKVYSDEEEKKEDRKSVV